MEKRKQKQKQLDPFFKNISMKKIENFLNKGYRKRKNDLTKKKKDAVTWRV